MGIYLAFSSKGSFNDYLNGWSHFAGPPEDLYESYYNLSGNSISGGGFTLTWQSEGEKRFRCFAFPYWFLEITTLAGCLFFQLRATRHRPGLCAICGYDLRASSDRCPECGNLVRATNRAQSTTIS